MAEDSPQRTGPVVLLPCNGLSARGLVTTLASDQISEAMEEIRRVDIVPLMAGLPEETSFVKQAKAVVGLAGCSYRCDTRACRKMVGRDPDETVVVGDLLRAEIIERKDGTEEEIQQCVLEVSTRVLGTLRKHW